MSGPDTPSSPDPLGKSTNPLGDPNFPEFGGEPDIEESLDKGTPAVSSAPGKTLVMILGLLGVAGFVLFSLFSGDDKGKKSKDIIPQSQTGQSASPAKAEPAPLPPPEPVAPPALPPPPVPLPPPPIPAPATASTENIDPNDPNNKAYVARLQSESVIFKGGAGLFGGGKKPDEDKEEEINDPNLRFAKAAIRNSEADQAKATRIGNLSRIIAQGKMVDCVLETAINSDLPGTLRAIVSHDVFAETGSHVLIPKGSRLIGTYNTGVQRGQNRVYIIWTRLLRPDGVDIQIGSEGTDNLGRAGVEGHVDNKFLEIFSSAILTSTITLGVAAAVESVTDSATSTQTTFEGGGTQESGSPTAIAAQEFVNTLGSSARGIIDQYLDVRPTITIDQGSRMKVFVNRDLLFPVTVTNDVTLIP